MSDLADIRLGGAGLARAPKPIAYAERTARDETALDRWARRATAPLATMLAAPARRYHAAASRRFAQRVIDACDGLADLDDRALAAQGGVVAQRLRRSGDVDGDALAAAFAVVREASGRLLNARHYPVQIEGAHALLRGSVIEMRTGEGKTLTATLAAAAHAFAGRPVHVITANDYLAARDAEEMGVLYRFFGLSVDVVRPGQDASERRAVYAADIVYASNKEIAFDYLRDRIVLRGRSGNLRRKLDVLAGAPQAGELRLRGLHAAIVDEADSVMIDEARTPLIIAEPGGEGGYEGLDLPLFKRARQAAEELDKGVDYKVSPNQDRVELTHAGRERLDDLADATEPGTAGAFHVSVIREHAVAQALAATHVFRRGEHYIVRDGKVAIVDEFTGRTMADRTWSDGLHQMIELKEGLEPTEPHKTLAKITYQRFFRRYDHLSGMTGTGRDATWEFWSVYRLAVSPIRPNRRDARVEAADRVLKSEADKWRAVIVSVREAQARGRPILIGARSVASAERLSARLDEAGIAHQVLSAAQDADEADKIARAGEPGRVTVATNMAGRGVDIRLGEAARAAGGLHVVLTERHDSRRVDRQLAGRCGRQGDPGSVEAYLSLEDALLQGEGSGPSRKLARVLLRAFGPRAAAVILRRRQKRVEAAHARMRRDLFDADAQAQDLFAVSGGTD